MSLSDDDLQRYNERCDPNLRILDMQDPVYVQLDDVRSDEHLPCVDVLCKGIQRARDRSCQLLTGFPGTGKTTELHKLARRLRNESKDLPTTVVFIDFEDWVDVYAPLSIAQALAVLAYHLHREAAALEGAEPTDQPGYLDELSKSVTQTTAALKGVRIDLFGAKFLYEIKDNESFRAKFEQAVAQGFRQFANEAFRMMADAVERIRRITGGAHRVVVIADGLEKITPVREQDRETVEASIENVFITHAQFLHLPCHVIYTFPLWLRFRGTELGAIYDDEPFVLPMVKVRDPSGATYERGVDKLVEMIGRRVDLGPVFGDDPAMTLRPLILASGGYLRDLLRLVRSLVRTNRSFPVRPSDTMRVISRLAEEYQRTVFATDLEILGAVATEHRPPRGAVEVMTHFGRLLGRHVILAYRNSMEWYDLHPLVRRDPIVEDYLAKKKP